ncbi:MAG: alanine racemase [Chloroflexi bacterium]|nr:alanine racemase [Chloroflexota bacterium]
MATTMAGNVLGEVGRRVTELDTPALVLDLEIFERNVARMAAHFRQAGVNWRPHTKGQKVPALVHKELAAGAFGATCAKLGEAEVLADAGISNLLIANQIVGRQKLNRLMALGRRASVLVGLDSEANAREINDVALAWGARQGVLIEIDSGMSRCGVPAGEPALALARVVGALPGLELRGVMSWEGHCIRLPNIDKPAAVEAALRPVIDTAEAIRAAGLSCEIVSCGGTGTYQFSAFVPGVTEIQAGGGVFGDLTYQNWGVEHERAMSLLATVISVGPERFVVDAGLKSASANQKAPWPKGIDGVKAVGMSAEHMTVRLETPSPVQVGDIVAFDVGYTDTTVFLHDVLYGARDGIVEAVWTVLGRGKTR